MLDDLLLDLLDLGRDSLLEGLGALAQLLVLCLQFFQDLDLRNSPHAQLLELGLVAVHEVGQNAW